MRFDLQLININVNIININIDKKEVVVKKRTATKAMASTIEKPFLLLIFLFFVVNFFIKKLLSIIEIQLVNN